MRSLVMFCLVIIFLMGALPHQALADSQINFLQIQCIPEVNYFSAKQISITSNKANEFYEDDNIRAKVKKNYKLLPESKVRGEIERGSCKVGNSLIEWSYEDIVEAQTGICGGANKGGFLKISSNGKLILKKEPIGGWIFDISCHASPLKQIEITDTKFDDLYLNLIGYWGLSDYHYNSPYFKLDSAFSIKSLMKNYGKCIAINIEDEATPKACEVLQKVNIRFRQ